ncbi:lysophospholipase [Enterovirga rhinocerotis]|uniref:Lysophospholipase n=1 Tax=Enterovirga rhinocerotis TaxID=1339210 RepID=A0A4R7CA67_9HYPH|nr:alpha/beta hydrolase [Enterovirga rhinocerotis]TDR93866.1 lysophospholipase [Enterovirga rhinocerotis]
MELLDRPQNPIPPAGACAPLVTRDGVRLRVASWPRLAGAEPRGTVLLLQGRAEFIEKYFETIDALLARGFAVVTFDWRGQGRSDRALPNRQLGHVARFDDFLLDYEAVHATIADERVVVLAHSMGAAVALEAAHDGRLQAERLACTNPMVGLSLVRAPAFSRRLARVLARAGLGRRIVPNGELHSISMRPFPGNRLSTDEARYARNAELSRLLEWAAIGSPTIGWLDTAYAAMERLMSPGYAAAIDIPTLLVLSGSDPVCSTPAMTAFGHALGRGHVLTIPEARHEILMETDAILATFWAAFDGFVAEAADLPVNEVA